MTDRSDFIAQVLDRVEVQPDGCLHWTGYVSPDGYGGLGRVNTTLHRRVWVAIYGEIPTGHVVDHLCHDPNTCEGGPSCPHRRCINPAHLAVVTIAENVRRAVSANARKTHCPKGHEYTDLNTYRYRDGRRDCRWCRRIRQINARRAA